MSEYDGTAVITDPPEGDPIEVVAHLDEGSDSEWGGHLIGSDWIHGVGLGHRPEFALRLPDGRTGSFWVHGYDASEDTDRVLVRGVGPAPFG